MSSVWTSKQVDCQESREDSAIELLMDVTTRNGDDNECLEKRTKMEDSENPELMHIGCLLSPQVQIFYCK